MTRAAEPEAEVFSKQRERYDAKYFSVYKNDPKRDAMYLEERARIERYKAGGRILDVGCGLGGFLEQFIPEKWDRYGIDVSDLAIAEARRRGIKVMDADAAYDYPPAHFDVIVFRGSLQLIPTPFETILKCIRLLAPGGYLVFLATPNSNSPYYRRFGTLPFLTPHANFLVPSDIMMRDALTNYGLRVVDIQYPYAGGPYARPLRDLLYFGLSYVGVRRKFPFWRSAMEIYAQKPTEAPA